MADLAFFLDYAPILCAQHQRVAVILYLYYDKFSNNRGIVTLTYKEICDCLGFSTRMIKKVDDKLERMGLIRTLSSEEIQRFDVQVKGKVKVRQVLSLEYMDDEERRVKLTQAGLATDKTILRDKYRALHMAMPEYQRLINLTSLQAAYSDLGLAHFQVRSKLARHLGLDPKITSLVLEDKAFKQKHQELAQLAKDNVEQRKPVAATKSKLRKTPAELYLQLMQDAHMTRATKKNSTPEPLPVDKWKSQAILRYFCLRYKKKYNIDYAFTKNPFNSREMGECKRLLGIFTPEDTVKYIDWLFQTQKNVTSPAYMLYPNILNQYRRIAEVNNPTATNGLTTDFVDWVKQTYPDFMQNHALSSIADLQWLDKLVQQKVSDDAVNAVVEKAQKIGIL